MANRKNKRAYLDDFQRDLTGTYQYCGAHCHYVGKTPRKTVLLRLLVYPLLLLVLVRVMHVTGMVADGKNILLTVFLACITPACATVTSMAQLYDKDAAKSSVLYVLTTICSIVTMPIMIGLYCAWL